MNATLDIQTIASIKKCIIDDAFLEMCFDGNVLDEIVEGYDHGFSISYGKIVHGRIVEFKLSTGEVFSTVRHDLRSLERYLFARDIICLYAYIDLSSSLCPSEL